MNNYLIEFLNLDNAFQYESFMANDVDHAVEQFSKWYPKCEPYNVFMQVNEWRMQK